MRDLGVIIDCIDIPKEILLSSRKRDRYESPIQ